jgi:hypothetical protein
LLAAQRSRLWKIVPTNQIANAIRQHKIFSAFSNRKQQESTPIHKHSVRRG